MIPSLLEAAGGSAGLLLSTREEQLDLLTAVLAATEADTGAEDLPGARGLGFRV